MRRFTLSLVAAVAVVGVLAGCSGSGSEEEAPAESSASGVAQEGDGKGGEASAVKHVRITKSGVEDHEVWGPDAYVVHYEIKNGGDGPADYFAQLEFLDGDGDVLGSTGVTADKLGAGKAKRGNTAPLDAEIENGKLSDIRSVRVSAVDRT